MKFDANQAAEDVLAETIGANGDHIQLLAKNKGLFGRIADMVKAAMGGKPDVSPTPDAPADMPDEGQPEGGEQEMPEEGQEEGSEYGDRPEQEEEPEEPPPAGADDLEMGKGGDVEAFADVTDVVFALRNIPAMLKAATQGIAAMAQRLDAADARAAKLEAENGELRDLVKAVLEGQGLMAEGLGGLTDAYAAQSESMTKSSTALRDMLVRRPGAAMQPLARPVVEERLAPVAREFGQKELMKARVEQVITDAQAAAYRANGAFSPDPTENARLTAKVKAITTPARAPGAAT